MKVLWCSISGHGFGHGAQMVPILNALAQRVSSLQIYLRTTLPPDFFQDRLQVSWKLLPAQQDVGCLHHGPLAIDVPATWEAYEDFHRGWNLRVSGEIQEMRAVAPDLVMSNVSYLGVHAGVRAGIPTVAMGSLSWDSVLDHFERPRPEHAEAILRHIRGAYHGAQLMIRLHPAVAMRAFQESIDVGPILDPPQMRRVAIRPALSMQDDERVVLVAFGGIPLDSAPLEQLDSLKGYRFVVAGMKPIRGLSRVTFLQELPYSFRQVFAEADILVSKPGYSTIVEAVEFGIPLVYVRRYNFVDEAPLLDYLHRYGRGLELDAERFSRGEWEEALDLAQRIRPPDLPAPRSGVSASADLLAEWL